MIAMIVASKLLRFPPDQRFVTSGDEKLAELVELESAICVGGESS
jgi:hypothetical protein